jgi:MarR family transcriptional regulator, organic hydroperoxide resistance regulator
MARTARKSTTASASAILKHWQEAVPNDRLAHLVKDVTRAYVRALQSRLSKHAVSFGHWAFLRILWERDGLNQRELSDEAGVMEPTTFSAIRAMEKLGYVERVQRPGDRRMVVIKLTAKGRALKQALVPLAEEVNGIGIRGVKPDDVATTRRTLLSILGNLEGDELRVLPAVIRGAGNPTAKRGGAARSGKPAFDISKKRTSIPGR